MLVGQFLVFLNIFTFVIQMELYYTVYSVYSLSNISFHYSFLFLSQIRIRKGINTQQTTENLGMSLITFVYNLTLYTQNLNIASVLFISVLEEVNKTIWKITTI